MPGGHEQEPAHTRPLDAAEAARIYVNGSTPLGAEPSLTPPDLPQPADASNQEVSASQKTGGDAAATEAAAQAERLRTYNREAQRRWRDENKDRYLANERRRQQRLRELAIQGDTTALERLADRARRRKAREQLKVRFAHGGDEPAHPSASHVLGERNRAPTDTTKPEPSLFNGSPLTSLTPPEREAHELLRREAELQDANRREGSKGIVFIGIDDFDETIPASERARRLPGDEGETLITADGAPLPARHPVPQSRTRKR